MNSVKLPNERKGFSVINSELTEVRVLGAAFIYNEENDFYNNKLLVVNSGVETIVEKNNFFASIEDFKNGEYVEWELDMCVCNFDSMRNVNHPRNKNEIDFWVFENGDAVHKNVTLKAFVVTFDENGKPVSLNTEDIPENVYSTKEECYSFNDITVVRENGEREIIVGAAKLVMLNDKQKEIVERLKAVLTEAKDNDIHIWQVWDKTYVFSTSDVKGYMAEYGSDIEAGYERVNLDNKEFIVDLPAIGVISEEDNLTILRK